MLHWVNWREHLVANWRAHRPLFFATVAASTVIAAFAVLGVELPLPVVALLLIVLGGWALASRGNKRR
jgi:hypothetical protein